MNQSTHLKYRICVPKTLHHSLTSYVVIPPFLLAASCVCHPHKNSDAAIVAAGKCCICTWLLLSDMEQPQEKRSSWDALGWIICLCRVLQVTLTSLSPAGMNSQTDAIQIEEGLPWLLVSPLMDDQVVDSRRGDHPHAHHTVYFLPTLLQLEQDQMLHLFQC